MSPTNFSNPPPRSSDTRDAIEDQVVPGLLEKQLQNLDLLNEFLEDIVNVITSWLPVSGRVFSRRNYLVEIKSGLIRCRMLGIPGRPTDKPIGDQVCKYLNNKYRTVWSRGESREVLTGQ